jgi:putative glycosyltransferase (TIGR04372 family)
MSFSDAIAQTVARLEFYRERIRQQGVGWAVARLIKQAVIIIGWFVLLPITLIMHLIRYRRVTVFTDRIGHLAAEVDCFVKERALGKLPARHWFILAPPHRVSNQHLLDYWRPHITVVTSPFLCALLGVMTWWRGLMVFDVSSYVLQLNATAVYYAVCAEWGNRPPLLQLSQADQTRGRDMLESMGMPRDAWFVCLQAREGGFSSADEILHQHRNSDVSKLIPAIEFITSRGGWCVRMGDPTTKPLPPLLQVIDYAHHTAHPEWMDIFLCASCRFFLGNSSGLSIVSSIFGVPCALANMVPLSCLGYASRDVSISKLLRRKNAHDYLSFGEVFKSPVADYRFARLYQDAGIEVEENSVEDILALTREMLDRVEGQVANSESDSLLQRRFHALLHPGHYGYGAASRVGTAFLSKYERLLP